MVLIAARDVDWCALDDLDTSQLVELAGRYVRATSAAQRFDAAAEIPALRREPGEADARAA